MLRKMTRKCLLVFCLTFVVIHGHPLDVGEGEAAFDNIDKANSELPIPFQQALNEGDMIIPQEAALKKEFGQWPNGYVPYTLSNSFKDDEKTKIHSALKLIMDAAPCLNFKEVTSGSAPNAHVSVIKSGGCWSMVGRTGGTQSLSLGNGCVYTGTIIHEFLHAIGFYHEQSRPDRDDYVTVNWGNIISGREHNFNKAKNIDSLGVDYDEKSVMHYSNGAFAKARGLLTLQSKKEPNLSLGGRELTTKDKLQINLKYCSGPGPKTTTTTTKRPTKPTNPPTPKTTTTKRPRTTTQRPKTTTRPTKPVTGACGDKSGYCIVALRSKRCNSYLNSLCPRTCHVCKGPEYEKCFNLRDKRSNCQEQAENGDCQMKDKYKRWIMKNLCPRSCCERNELYK